MKIIKNIVLSLLIVGLGFYVIVGCSDGGDSDDVSSGIVIQTKTIDINVTLPASSPISNDEASIYVYGEESQVGADGLVKVIMLTGRIIDVSLLLPARAGEEFPTVYLSSTVLPGEIDIDINSEETALALILDGIPQKYLQDPELALYVKDLVRRESVDFVAYFKISIEADPYLLREDNIRNVLGQEFLDTLTNINTILYDTFDASASVPSAPSASSLYTPVNSIPSKVSSYDTAINSEDGAGTSDSNRITIQPKREPYDKFLLYEVTENGQYTGDLTLWNYSLLPSLYRMTNTSTGEVVREIPIGNIAFSPDIFAPYGCPFNILLPNYTLVKSGSKNVQLEIYTPGFKDYDSSVYNEVGSPSEALLMRSAYSYAFIPIFNATLNLKGMEAIAYDILQKANVLDDLLPYWSSGDIVGGIKKLFSNFNNLPKASILSLIEAIVSKTIGDPKVLIPVLTKKIITSEISIATAALAVGQLGKGLSEAPSKMTYYVTFPVGIKDVQPLAVKKVELDEPLPEITLHGHGFKSFEFKGKIYNPTLQLKICDKDGNDLYTIPLEYSDLSVNLTGTAITFSLPRNAARVDTNLSYVEVQLKHAYVDVSWLDEISNYFNEVNDIELPVTEALQKEFTIHLSSDLYVSKVDQDWQEINDTFLIYGEGFHSQKSGMVNEVFFIENSVFSPAKAVINEAWDEMISARVPEALELDYLSIGKTFFYVKLVDGSESNEFPLSIVPTPVKASVIGDTSTPGLIYKGQKVTLYQESSVPIYYSLNGSVEQRYIAPIELLETSTLYAYSAIDINGTTYRSRSSIFKYETCGEDETYIPYPHGAQCVIIQNQHLIPTRYCPIHGGDFNGEITTDNFKVNCSYAAGDSGQVGGEVHYVFEDGLSRQVAYVWYWTEPIGRPMYVRRGDEEHHLCPDGAIMLPDIPCSH